MTANCPFCAPQLDESRIMAETQHSYSIMSNPRSMPYHALVLPKRHVWHPWELTSQETSAIQQQIVAIQQALFQHLKQGSDVRQQFRPFMEQSRYHNIRHVHFHILPRAFNDQLYELAGQYEPFELVSNDVIAKTEELFRL